MLKTICRSRRSCLLILGAAVVLCALTVCAVPALAAQDVEDFILNGDVPTVEMWIESDAEAAVTLAPEKCAPIESYIENEAADFPLSASGAARDAMEAFYAETGVQPYLIVTDDYELDADTYLPRRYERLFGSDEGHYLLLLISYGDDSFELLDYAGADAADVLQGSALEMLSTHVYSRGAELAADPETVLSEAFREAAKTVTEPADVQYAYYDNGVFYDADTGEEIYRDLISDYNDTSFEDGAAFAFIFPVIFAGVAIVAAVVRKAKKEEEAQKKTPPVIYVQMPQAPARKDAGPRRAQFPVTCPGCGATAYPNDDGTCQYCGRAIFDPRG